MADLTRSKVVEILSSNQRGIDLTGSNLSGLDLNSLNFSYAKLGRANLNGCNLQYAKFNYADLHNASLQRSDIRGANFENAYLTNTNFTGSIVDGVTSFKSADVKKAIISQEQIKTIQTGTTKENSPIFRVLRFLFDGIIGMISGFMGR